MIVQAKVRLYIPCPSCTDGSWRADQLHEGQSTTWTCNSCHREANILRVDYNDFRTTPTGRKETPVVVTLRSDTKPAITVRLNTWKYAHSQKDTKKEYEEHQRFYYDEHTCPTNWIKQVEEISVGKDKDPHGIFEFVSCEDGTLVDSPHCDGMMVQK